MIVRARSSTIHFIFTVSCLLVTATSVAHAAKSAGARHPIKSVNSKAQAAQPAAQTKTAKIETRTVEFPKTSIGGLYLIPKVYEGLISPLSEFAVAKGKVTFAKSNTQELFLRTNTNFLANPHFLDAVAPDAIDALEIKAVLLSDEEEKMSDKLIEPVARLSGLKHLFIPTIGPSDSALSKLRTVTNLTTLQCNIGKLDGSCLSALQSLPNLESIDLGDNNIKTTSYATLAKFPKLNRIVVTRCNLSDEGLQLIAKCSTLKILTISGNAGMSNKSIKYVLPLKKLEALDIMNTAITPEALSQLKSLNHLHRIYVSQKYFAPDNVRTLMKALPGVTLIVDKALKPVTKDVGRIFAPIR